MGKLARRLSGWTFLLVTCLTTAHAQSLNTAAAHLKITLAEVLWRVNADATHVYEQTVEREALSEQGAQSATKFTQMYNKALQRLEVVEAYTLKADGRKIPVGKEGIQTQRGVASGDMGASWPEAEIVQITFPNVQKGDSTGWKTRLTTHTPVLPGWASLSEYLSPSLDVDKFSARIEAPQSLNLQVFASGMGMSTSQSGLDQVWQIDASNIAKLIDNNAANASTSYPRLFASTFKDHTELVQAYASQANAKAMVSAEVRALAEKITTGKTTPLDKASALHDWVRKNIRYVAVYLGAGGWAPHDVDWILAKRYGDCKDHALLLQTLLKAVDIEAVAALINTYDEYALPELPVGFNHSLVYLPGLNLFADPTDSRFPLGSLPWSDSDKPVAVALASGAAMMRTPAISAQSNRMTIKTTFDISSAGKAAGRIELDTQGLAATTLQDHLSQIPSGMGGLAVQKILESSGLRGRGFTRYAPVQREQQIQALQITDLEIDNLLNDPHGGSVNAHPALNLPMYISKQMGNYSAAKRDYAYACWPIYVREEFELRFDPVFQLLRLPANLKETHPDGITFEAQYHREGNTVQGWRELTLSYAHHVCSAQDYAARKPVMNRIAQHLRSSVLYQQ